MHNGPHLSEWQAKDRVRGVLLQGFSGLPPQVDARLLVDSPKISIEIYSDSSVLKKRTHVGHKF